MSATRCRTRIRQVLTVVVPLMATACMSAVPITTGAMPGNDVRIVSPAAMPLWRVPRQGPPVDEGCRVMQVEGRAERIGGDTAWLSPVTWWRAEPGARDRCERVGYTAMLLLPDSATRNVTAMQVDRRRTGWLVGSIVGTVLLIVAGLALLISALIGGF